MSWVCQRAGMTDDGWTALFDDAGRDGAVCVLDVDGTATVEFNADEVVETASAFKIAVALEVFCQAADGDLGLGEWLRVDAEKAPLDRGTVTQAVHLMMSVSDNAATNALLHRVGGRRAIMDRLTALGLRHTTVPHDVLQEIREIVAVLDQAARGAGFADWSEPAAIVARGGYDQIAERLARISIDRRALPPGKVRSDEHRPGARLPVAMIWRDRAGPPEACAGVRAVTHELRNRIALGFSSSPDVGFAGKGGSLPGVVNNDIGVLTCGDQHRYAIAIFTRAKHPFAGETASTQLIGTVAAAAIRQLRTAGGGEQEQ